MSQEITERDYPVEKSWILRAINPFSMIISFAISIATVVIVVRSFYKGEILDGITQTLTKEIKIVILIVLFLVVSTIINKIIVPFIRAYLWYKNFHYALREREIVVTQGILSKVERLTPYETLQDVSVSQDFWDRIFGTATLKIQNAGSTGLGGSPKQMLFTDRSTGMIMPLGTFGGSVIISSLKRDNVEKLKEMVLQKIKENPARIESGL